MNWFLISLIFLVMSCNKKHEPQISDEYVLVEFASKLEEDQQRLEQVNSKK